MPGHAFTCALLLACGCLSWVNAHAADSMGVVKTLKGQVHIERSGKNVDVQIGSDVFSSDRVVTGPESSVGITLRDTTLLTEGANSVLELNKFAFNTTTYDGT